MPLEKRIGRSQELVRKGTTASRQVVRLIHEIVTGEKKRFTKKVDTAWGTRVFAPYMHDLILRESPEEKENFWRWWNGHGQKLFVNVLRDFQKDNPSKFKEWFTNKIKGYGFKEEFFGEDSKLPSKIKDNLSFFIQAPAMNLSLFEGKVDRTVAKFTALPQLAASEAVHRGIREAMKTSNILHETENETVLGELLEQVIFESIQKRFLPVTDAHWKAYSLFERMEHLEPKNMLAISLALVKKLSTHPNPNEMNLGQYLGDLMKKPVENSSEVLGLKPEILGEKIKRLVNIFKSVN